MRGNPTAFGGAVNAEATATPAVNSTALLIAQELIDGTTGDT